MPLPTANAGGAQSFPFADLPKTVTLDGTASSSPNGAITAYRWYRLSRPAGSAMALSSSTASQPTFTADLAGTYVVFLEVQDATGVWSERNPLKAPNTAFALISARTQVLDVALPGTGQRNYGSVLNAVLSALETTVGAADAHLAGDADAHTDAQITYTRPDGARPNIGAADDTVRAALDKLDDTIAALSSLTTTDKASVVAAVNEVATVAAAAKAAVDAAVATSAGSGDTGKLVELASGGKISASVHGYQTDQLLHAGASLSAHGFMSASDYSKLSGIEAGADVTDETNVLAALAVSSASKDVGGAKVTNAAQPTSPGEAVPLNHDSFVDGALMRDGAQKLAIVDGETVTIGDICEFYVGGRYRKAATSSRHPCGVALTGGTGDAGGTVFGKFQDRGVVDLVVENGGATVVGRRVVVSTTANQIDDAGLDVVSGTLGIALDTVTGDGTTRCPVYLQPIGGQ